MYVHVEIRRDITNIIQNYTTLDIIFQCVIILSERVTFIRFGVSYLESHCPCLP